MIFAVLLFFIISCVVIYLLLSCLNRLYELEDTILNLNERGGFDVFDIST